MKFPHSEVDIWRRLIVLVVFLQLRQLEVECRKIHITELKCLDHAESVCSNLVCTLNESSKKRSLINIGCNIKKSTDDVIVRYFEFICLIVRANFLLMLVDGTSVLCQQ